MNNVEALINQIQQMKNSSIQNYVVAGLKSSLIGGGNFGMVRLFEGSRHQQDFISPHSHRFDFACLVLRGKVTNRIWRESSDENADFFQVSVLHYSGTVGEHIKKPAERSFWLPSDTVYCAGDIYTMSADQVHSIIFSRESVVLFFEGPNIKKQSIVLEPVVDGSVIPTYEKHDYMFKRIAQEAI